MEPSGCDENQNGEQEIETDFNGNESIEEIIETENEENQTVEQKPNSISDEDQNAEQEFEELEPHDVEIINIVEDVDDFFSEGGESDVNDPEEDEVIQIPNMDVAFYAHFLSYIDSENRLVRKHILALIEENAMAPIYEKMCESYDWCSFDDRLLAQVQLTNYADLLDLEDELKEAQNQGIVAVNNLYLKKFEYYSKIGHKELAVEYFSFVCPRLVPLGRLFESLFQMVRVGIFFLDFNIMRVNLKRLEDLLILGGDWEKKNRFKIYQGVYCIAIRDFKTACARFVDTISTFTCLEIMKYSAFIKYTVYLAMMVLPRHVLKKKIIENPQVTPTLAKDSLLRRYVHTLHHCQYAEFFASLAGVEVAMIMDFFFFPHYRYYVREMKVKVYSQIMESYKSLSILHIAQEFKCSEEYIEEDLVVLIRSGRLYCKIDRVSKTIETHKNNTKNHQFQMIIKQGDNLLNRIQKLSRVIQI